jgi:hypothetical protein
MSAGDDDGYATMREDLTEHFPDICLTVLMAEHYGIGKKCWGLAKQHAANAESGCVRLLFCHIIHHLYLLHVTKAGEEAERLQKSGAHLTDIVNALEEFKISLR